MTRPVTVGLDGSPESLAAADRAARKACLGSAPLRMANAWPREPQPEPPPGREAAWRRWAERTLRTAQDGLVRTYPGPRIAVEQIPGFPVGVLALAAAAHIRRRHTGRRGRGARAVEAVRLHSGVRARRRAGALAGQSVAHHGVCPVAIVPHE